MALPKRVYRKPIKKYQKIGEEWGKIQKMKEKQQLRFAPNLRGIEDKRLKLLPSKAKDKRSERVLVAYAKREMFRLQNLLQQSNESLPDDVCVSHILDFLPKMANVAKKPKERAKVRYILFLARIFLENSTNKPDYFQKKYLRFLGTRKKILKHLTEYQSKYRKKKSILSSSPLLTRNVDEYFINDSACVVQQEKKLQYDQYLRKQKKSWNVKRNLKFETKHISEVSSVNKALQINLNYHFAALALFQLHKQGRIDIRKLYKQLVNEDKGEGKVALRIRSTIEKRESQTLDDILKQFGKKAPMYILRTLTPKWLNHPIIAKEVLKHDASSFELLGNKIKKDPKWIKKFLFKAPSNLKHLDSNYKGDKNLIRKLIKIDAEAFLYASYTVQTDLKIARDALKNKPELIYESEVPQIVKKDTKVLLTAARSKNMILNPLFGRVKVTLHQHLQKFLNNKMFKGPDGLKLAKEFMKTKISVHHLVPNAFFNDREFCILAIYANAYNIIFVSPKFIMDSKFIEEAIRKNPYVYGYLRPKDMNEVKNFKNEQLKKQKMLLAELKKAKAPKQIISLTRQIKTIKNKLVLSKKYFGIYTAHNKIMPVYKKKFLPIILEAFKKDVGLYEVSLPLKYRNDPKIVERVIKADYKMLYLVPYKFKYMEKYLVIAARQNGRFVMDRFPDARKNFKVALAAVINDPACLYLVDPGLINKKDFILSVFKGYKGVFDTPIKNLSNSQYRLLRNKKVLYQEWIKAYLPKYAEIFDHIPP
ncbi:DUF4116 domain-containing protein, partial [Patescibacteria group bacterium]|nr:DUF4116 domain-containing protein [Patescibacteria group bacterium]